MRPQVLQPSVDPEDGTESASEAVRSAEPAPRSYMRSRGAGAATSAVGIAAPAPRASRALITDYGYVVSELKRIGLTFGGLVVLLVVLSRRLH